MENNNNEIIKIKDLSFCYKHSKEVLCKLSFNVNKAEIISIIGPNGSGKTTLFKILNKFLINYKGSIEVNGENLKKISIESYSKKIAYVSQSRPNIFPISIKEFVLLGRYPFLKSYMLPDNKDYNKVERILELFELKDLSHKPLTELSGGELQRVCIAQALVKDPEILFLDEPANNLDLKHQVDMIRILKDLALNKKCTVITIMHDINLASLLSTRIILLKNGSINNIGSPRNIINKNSIKDIFNVNAEVVNDNIAGNGVLVKYVV
ncbi:MAG: ABC transporter ATP-binding protein [Pseudomonadota bacterium]